MAAKATVAGFGPASYIVALDAVLHLLRHRERRFPPRTGVCARVSLPARRHAGMALRQTFPPVRLTMGHDTGDKTAATMAIDSALVRELAELLADTGLSEIEVEDGSRKIRVARTLTAAPVAQMVAAPAPAARLPVAAPPPTRPPPPIWPVRSSRRWSAPATSRPNRARRVHRGGPGGEGR
jgi:hypothetical protein